MFDRNISDKWKNIVRQVECEQKWSEVLRPKSKLASEKPCSLTDFPRLAGRALTINNCELRTTHPIMFSFLLVAFVFFSHMVDQDAYAVGKLHNLAITLDLKFDFVIPRHGVVHRLFQVR